MRTSSIRQISLGAFAALLTMSTVGAAPPPSPVQLDSARVVINGSSNVHAWSAATTAVKVARIQLADAGKNLVDVLDTPDTLQLFEVVIPAASLTSPKDGLDKNMHKALKVTEHADITFRVTRLEATSADAFRATGALRIAGVERAVALELTASRNGGAIAIKGSVDLLMTDYGITPPKAMLGMLKTDPKVTVQVEAVLSTAVS